jgi:hypothetical protein
VKSGSSFRPAFLFQISPLDQTAGSRNGSRDRDEDRARRKHKKGGAVLTNPLTLFDGMITDLVSPDRAVAITALQMQ